MNETTQQIAQLIGNKGFYMMGAYNMVYDNKTNSISFKVKGSKAANHIRIAYDGGTDLYNMTFTRIWGSKIAKQEVLEGVYVDMVRELITEKTGLYLSL